MNNHELAKQFKDVIKNDFNKALQGERFDYNGKKDLTFEELLERTERQIKAAII